VEQSLLLPTVNSFGLSLDDSRSCWIPGRWGHCSGHRHFEVKLCGLGGREDRLRQVVVPPEQAARNGDPDQGPGAGNKPPEGARKAVQPQEEAVHRKRQRGRHSRVFSLSLSHLAFSEAKLEALQIKETKSRLLTANVHFWFRLIETSWTSLWSDLTFEDNFYVESFTSRHKTDTAWQSI